MRAFVNCDGTVIDLINEYRSAAPSVWLRSPLPEAPEDRPDFFEATYRMPSHVGWFIEAVREGLGPDASERFTERFIPALGVGADLRDFGSRIMAALLTDADSPFPDAGSPPGMAVAALYERRLAGDEPTRDEWESAASRAAKGATPRLLAAEAAHMGAHPRNEQDLALLLRNMVGLAWPEGNALETWEKIGAAGITAAQSCRPPASLDGEPEACVLCRWQEYQGSSGDDAVCAGTSAHCEAAIERLGIPSLWMVESRDSMTMLAIVSPDVDPDDALPSLSP